MSAAFERGSVEARSDAQARKARVVCGDGEVYAGISCVDVDWERWIGAYHILIANNTDLSLHAYFRNSDLVQDEDVPIRAFSVFERTVPIRIPVAGAPPTVEIEGSGLAFFIDFPVPDRPTRSPSGEARIGSI